MNRILRCLAIIYFTATCLAHGQVFKDLYNFSFPGPYGTPLIQGDDGSLYGSTFVGHDPVNGTIFRISTSGVYLGRGVVPAPAPLLQASDGNIYAGSQDYAFEYTTESLVKIGNNQYETLAYFGYTTSPITLIEATDGNLYGTNGVAFFRYTLDGQYTTLYSFSNEDGVPSGLTQGTDGSFYGTTGNGGPYGYGTIFRLTAEGEFQTLYTFHSIAAAYPSGLVQGPDGSFYGVTGGGTLAYNQNNGTVFKFTLPASLIILYSFSGGNDGGVPNPLIQATDGKFYGTTFYGGSAGKGTIFEITPAGALSTLWSFAGLDGGSGSDAALLQHTDGLLYGIAGGGTFEHGLIFSFSLGFAPFVKPIPAGGSVGQEVHILGTNLQGTTAVSFNGVEAAFTVVSSSEIATSVPPNATTGSIRVTTPAATFVSNVVFRIVQ